MIFSPFHLTRTSQYALSILLVTLNTLSYGQQALFQKLYMAVLLAVALLSYCNLNMLSIVAIALFVHLIDEISWLVIDNHPMERIIIYGGLCALLFTLKEDPFRWPIALLTTLCLLTEGYWLITDYNAPFIHWYLWLILVNLLLRRALLIRVFVLATYYPDRAQSLPLDYDLRNIVSVYIILHSLIVLEYLVRHLLDVKILTLWTVSPYLFHALTAYSAWLILSQSLTLLRQQRLSS